MFTTIFSGIPKGVSVRRLNSGRKAPKQPKSFKFTAYDDKGRRAYGNSIRDAIKRLGTDVETVIQ